MTISHANDSYVREVTEFSGLDVKGACKAQTIATLLQGVTGFVATTSW